MAPPLFSCRSIGVYVEGSNCKGKRVPVPRLVYWFSRRRALSLTIRAFSSGAMESEPRENAPSHSSPNGKYRVDSMEQQRAT